MKSTGFLTILLIFLLPGFVSAQTAKTTLFCWSLHFQQGQGPTDETLDLSTISGTPNGELAPWYSLYTHRSGFALDYSGFPITGNLFIDLPDNVDANDDGFDDSLQVSQGINDTSVGEYTTDVGGGVIFATWNRTAGSKDGSCTMHLVDDDFGDLGTYQFTFEVLEYTGLLTYTPGTNDVTATVNLTNATDQLFCPFYFLKDSGDPHNALELQGSGCTNSGMQVLTYGARPIFRDPNWPTNYYGMIIFTDGNLSTPDPDYRTWELSIDDLNDSDNDTVPNFSDELPIPPPQPSLLSLSLSSTNLLLTLTGDVGRLYHILENTNLTDGNWVTNQSVVLTSSPQTIALPLPDLPADFFRTVAP